MCGGGERERGKREGGKGDLSFIREVPGLKLRSSGSKCLHPFLIKNKTVSGSPQHTGSHSHLDYVAEDSCELLPSCLCFLSVCITVPRFFN